LRLRQEFADQLTRIDVFDRRNTILMERLHKEVLNTRMRPFSSLVQGWPRFVRDLGKTLDKEVRLEMSGLATLVDREVLERIDVPLKHIIQNAIDHGIEHPDARIDKEKPRIGAIILHVHHSAGQLLIQLQDDGVGVDFNNLKKKIVKKGLATTKQLENATEDQLLEYLFIPGFSTRDHVNEISGRGVGLDLVKSVVTQLNGSIRVSSEKGKGTKFELILPLTVSIIRTLVVQLGGEQYGVPMARIHRIMSVPVAAIQNDNVFFVNVEGQRVDLAHANTIFDMPYNKPNKIEEVPVIVFQHGASLVGWVVESFLGEHELAVQKIDPLLGKIPGIKSAAVRQDGIIVLMVDSEELLRLVEKRRQENRIDIGLTTLAGSNVRKRVLVVDQSRSSRERLKRLLSERGYDVVVETALETVMSTLGNDHFDAVVWGVEDDDGLLPMLENDTRLHTIPMLFFTDEPRSNANANLPWRFLSKADFQSALFLTYIKKMVEA
jgi:two-component system sensor histidine kinase and response regulator WspE